QSPKRLRCLRQKEFAFSVCEISPYSYPLPFYHIFLRYYFPTRSQENQREKVEKTGGGDERRLNVGVMTWLVIVSRTRLVYKQSYADRFHSVNGEPMTAEQTTTTTTTMAEEDIWVP